MQSDANTGGYGEEDRQPSEAQNRQTSHSITAHDPDRGKLHNEINQINNQRFLITGAAATAFLLLVVLPIPGSLTEIDSFAVGASIRVSLYCAISFVLFTQSFYLRRMMRIYTAYLIEKKWSAWEMDWDVFREDDWLKKRVNNKLLVVFDLLAHASIFASLAVVAVIALAVIAAYLSTLPVGEHRQTWIALTLALVLCVGNLWYVLVYGRDDPGFERECRERWKEVLKQKRMPRR